MSCTRILQIILVALLSTCLFLYLSVLVQGDWSWTQHYGCSLQALIISACLFHSCVCSLIAQSNDLLHCKGMLLTHVQFIVCLDPLPKSLSAKVLSSQSASFPSCMSAWDYLVPGMGPFPLQLLNFMKFLLAHLCGVLGSLRRAGLASTT